jgi:hypothetical protein
MILNEKVVNYKVLELVILYNFIKSLTPSEII